MGGTIFPLHVLQIVSSLTHYETKLHTVISIMTTKIHKNRSLIGYKFKKEKNIHLYRMVNNLMYIAPDYTSQLLHSKLFRKQLVHFFVHPIS